jgi:hypothetical protein
MSAPTIAKPQIVAAMNDLPENATVDDAFERLALLSRVAQAQDDFAAGRTFTQAEVRADVEARRAARRG